jgi:hypothetical protein
MDGYNFSQDFFDTYQSLADWIKAVWLVVPPTFVLTIIWLWRQPMTPPETTAHTAEGRLLYSVYRDGDNRTHIVSYVHEPIGRPDILLLDTPEIDRFGHKETLALVERHTDNSEGR